MRAKILSLATFVSLAQGHAKNLTVDLGYERYTGVYNENTTLNQWFGIRYAAPPVGDLRWRAPVGPEHTGKLILADDFGAPCLQSNAPGVPLPLPTREKSEDCLFLNVYAPQAAKNLPVYVFIHGGGYGQGDGSQDGGQDLAGLINDNENKFIGVSLNYRLGAFGLLSSEDVKENGDLNVGLLDQQFALEWIQKNIHLFGGDKSQVTIYGISAGGGSVIYHTMAYGGSQGNKLFDKAIAASPYLTRQYNYNDDYPTQLYEQFVKLSGCEGEADRLSCLRSKDSETLNASNTAIIQIGTYGIPFSFSPVTDGSFIRYRATEQLLEKKTVNGNYLWATHNADEAPFFVPNSVLTEEDLIEFLHIMFPDFDENDIASVLETYPLTGYSENPDNPRFATAGDSGPTSVEVSLFGIGNQQRAYAVWSESIIQCPSYWLATSYTGRPDKPSYLSTYTSPLALHGFDMFVYLGPVFPGEPHFPFQGPEFVLAWRKMLGAYILSGSPNIPADVANNPGSDVLSNWPVWGDEHHMVDFNQTAGTPYLFDTTNIGLTHGLVPVDIEPGLRNAFREVDAETWEGGRGRRCDFWKSMGSKVPY